MNFRRKISSTALLLVASAALLWTSCKKDVIYDVEPLPVLQPSANKDKLKTTEQYVAILHANLFQAALSADQLFEVSECFESIGDQELAREVLISNFFNAPGVIMPENRSSILLCDCQLFLHCSLFMLNIKISSKTKDISQ